MAKRNFEEDERYKAMETLLADILELEEASKQIPCPGGWVGCGASAALGSWGRWDPAVVIVRCSRRLDRVFGSAIII
eukprot:6125555-Pyramimonas_sp.AAC.1